MFGLFDSSPLLPVRNTLFFFSIWSFDTSASVLIAFFILFSRLLPLFLLGVCISNCFEVNVYIDHSSQG